MTSRENQVDFALEKRSECIKQLGDRLDGFSILINWKRFLTVGGDMYQNHFGFRGYSPGSNSLPTE
ncbi:MAG: hypothetical protein METHP_01943 [Methanoregula sp. SKADARSKE-2]|nr:MAG: hypothetical protein METHP_01943 [Methanoregula sp. SKADARSKE-2]